MQQDLVEDIGEGDRALQRAIFVDDEREMRMPLPYGLELLFQRYVGFPPKLLAGIFRFQKFYRKWAQGQSYDVMKGEVYDDYYDEAHFCNEFKRMTGYSPRRYTLDVPNEFGRRLTLK